MQETVIVGFTPWRRASRTGTGPYGAAPPAMPWALLPAGIDEVFPLLCPECGRELRIVAFITDDCTVRDILAHLGEPTAPPRIAIARAPPLWTVERWRLAR